MFFVWALNNHFFSTDISAVSALRDAQENILQQDLSSQQKIYSFLINIVPMAILIMVFLIGFSYSHSQILTKIFSFVLVPIFGLLIFYMMFSQDPVSKVLWPDMGSLRGLGWSDLSLFLQISEDYDETGMSAFISRYIALGSVGAYGLYILFFPILYVAFKAKVSASRFCMMVGILAVLLALDIFWQESGAYFVALIPAFALLGYLQGSAVQVIKKWSLDKRTKIEHII